MFCIAHIVWPISPQALRNRRGQLISQKIRGKVFCLSALERGWVAEAGHYLTASVARLPSPCACPSSGCAHAAAPCTTPCPPANTTAISSHGPYAPAGARQPRWELLGSCLAAGFSHGSPQPRRLSASPSDASERNGPAPGCLGGYRCVFPPRHLQYP